MADVTINGSTGPDPEFGGTNCGPHWKTDQIGYRFFVSSALKVQYSKTTDGGATWSAGVTVLDTGESTDGYIRFSCWFDQETTGDSGTKIHIAGEDSHNNRVRYRSLDISSDTLGTEVTVATVTSFLQGGGYPDKNWLEAGMCPITKSRGGNLYCAFGDVAGGVRAWKLYRSTDGGATWASRNAGYGLTTNSFDNQIQLLPASDVDSNDIAAITLQDNYPTATASLYLWLHDDSANSWGNQTTIDTLSSDGGDWADYVWWGDAILRHSDGKAICAYWSRSDYASPGSGNLKVAELTLTAAGIAVTAKTSVITGTSGGQDCSAFINQATGDLYVFYARGTWYSSTNVFYKKSTDGGATWGTETQFNATTHNIQHTDAGHSVKSGQAGRFCPSWADIDNLDILTNAANSVAITTGGGGSAGSSAPTLTADATGRALVAAAASAAPPITGGATGKSLAAAAGSSAPILTASATGAAKFPAAGSSAPAITAGATGAETMAGAGSSAPPINGAATSTALKQAAGSSTPVTTGAATGQETAAGAGSSSPAVTANATGASLAQTSGSSAPTINAAAAASGGAAAGGSSAPTLTADATGRLLAAAAGSSAPPLTGSATGKSQAAAAGSSAPSLTADAAANTGASAGSSLPAITGSATGRSLFTASGSALPVLTGGATSSWLSAGAGSSAPTTTADATARSLAASAGSSSPPITGSATATKLFAGAGSSAPTTTADATGRKLATGVGSSSPSIAADATANTPGSQGSSAPIITANATGASRAATGGSSSPLLTGSATARALIPAAGASGPTLTAGATGAAVVPASGSSAPGITASATTRWAATASSSPAFNASATSASLAAAVGGAILTIVVNATGIALGFLGPSRTARTGGKGNRSAPVRSGERRASATAGRSGERKDR